MVYTGEKKREYQRAWMSRRRKEWFDKNGPCKCGSWENLELDHINREAKVTHNVWSWSEERRNKELGKCQVLCRECHMEKTIREMPVAKHDNGSMYTNYRCRCDICKKWKSEYDKRNRHKWRNG